MVGAGALAAWLFEPVPGAPPAPTEPPSYSTSEQEDPITSDPITEDTGTTTEEPAACPFTAVDAGKDFASVPAQPKWTVEIPSLTVSSMAPDCTKQGKNDQLLRAADPGYILELSEVFCKTDLSKDQSKSLGQGDLSDGSTYKDYDYGDVNIQFDFDFTKESDNCAKNCVDAYNTLVSGCKPIIRFLN